MLRRWNLARAMIVMIVMMKGEYFSPWLVLFYLFSSLGLLIGCEYQHVENVYNYVYVVNIKNVQSITRKCKYCSFYLYITEVWREAFFLRRVIVVQCCNCLYLL